MRKDEIVESKKSAPRVSGSVVKTDRHERNFVKNHSDLVMINLADYSVGVPANYTAPFGWLTGREETENLIDGGEDPWNASST
jgi:hypothetical protein